MNSKLARLSILGAIALSLALTQSMKVNVAARTIASGITCVTNPVVANNNDSGAGSLRQAITDACDGSTITFAGTVVSPITLTTAQLLIDGKSLTIQGPGTRPMTISGNGANRVFQIIDRGLTIQVTLSNLTIADGQTGQDPAAAGVFENGIHATVNIISCSISGNGNVGGPNGGQGGGVFNNGIMNIINSTISGNSATQQADGGAGIFNNGTLNLTNCTISGNSTNTSGGGIRNNGGTINIENTIIAGNTASGSGPDVFNAFHSLGFNLIGESDNSTGFTNGVNNDQVGSIALPLDSKLGSLQNNGGPTFTMALLANSPAIDTGDDSVQSSPLSLTNDQRGSGFPRKSGTHLDIGALELLQCTLTCPENITQGNDVDQCGAVVAYPSPTDNGACGTIGCSPASGSFYPTGTTTVTCSPKQDSPVSCSFTITVNDTQGPTIICPMNQTLTANNNCQAVGTYSPTATDNCTPSPAVSCTPPSGSAFNSGTTTVNCKATDSVNNMSTCSFTVTVSAGFNVCLQDDGNPNTVFLGNSVTGAYSIMCGGTAFSGVAQVTRRGNVATFVDNSGGLRMQASIDSGVFKGTASLQSPPGTNKCTITDRDTRNNSCACH